MNSSIKVYLCPRSHDVNFTHVQSAILHSTGIRNLLQRLSHIGQSKLINSAKRFCPVALPQGAVGLSAVCDCGIS